MRTAQDLGLGRATVMADVKGVAVVLGGQWGDEGKGKLVDILAQDADIVARCQVKLRLRN